MKLEQLELNENLIKHGYKDALLKNQGLSYCKYLKKHRNINWRVVWGTIEKAAESETCVLPGFQFHSATDNRRADLLFESTVNGTVGWWP